MRHPTETVEANGEDYLIDAADATLLMADGAHLVGLSYGGLGDMFAAARSPAKTRSSALARSTRVMDPPRPSRAASARRQDPRHVHSRTSRRPMGAPVPVGGRNRPRRSAVGSD